MALTHTKKVALARRIKTREDRKTKSLFQTDGWGIHRAGVRKGHLNRQAKTHKRAVERKRKLAASEKGIGLTERLLLRVKE